MHADRPEEAYAILEGVEAEARGVGGERNPISRRVLSERVATVEAECCR